MPNSRALLERAEKEIKVLRQNLTVTLEALNQMGPTSSAKERQPTI
jgi:hypothetical protein